MVTRRTRRAYTKQTPKAPVAETASEPASEVPHVEAAAPEAPRPAPSVARPEMRAEMRPPMRDSRAEAEARAKQIFANVDLDSEEDKFSLPPNFEPDGWEYEWKTLEVYGKRNPGNEVQMARMGWEPVDTSRHPEMMPSAYSGPIVREGMGLMERPKIVNDRQRQANYQKAVSQVRGQEVQVGIAPKNTLQRFDSRGAPVSKVTREFVPPSALKDEGFVQVGTPIPE